MEASELLKKVRRIEIKTRGLSNQIFSGEYHSAFKGRGMAFSEVRQYQPGDDVRRTAGRGGRFESCQHEFKLQGRWAVSLAGLPPFLEWPAGWLMLSSWPAPLLSLALRLRWRVAPELPGLCGITLGDRGLAEQVFTADERGGFRLALPHRGPFELVAEHAGERATPYFPGLAGAFVELQLKAPVRVLAFDETLETLELSTLSPWQDFDPGLLAPDGAPIGPMVADLLDALVLELAGTSDTTDWLDD